MAGLSRIPGRAATSVTSALSKTHSCILIRWAAVWNRNLAMADEIIAPNFVAQFVAAGTSAGEVHDPEGLKQWIGGTLAAFSNASFTTGGGPLADEGMVAGRWIFRATYQGGMPGASPAALGKASSMREWTSFVSKREKSPNTRSAQTLYNCFTKSG